MFPVQDTDHKTEARKLVIGQFNGLPVIQGILDSWVNRIQELETAVYDVILKRFLDAATDAQLDSVGDLVGEPRDSRGDTDYREAIRLRIRIDRSHGKGEDVIQVVNIATEGFFTYTEYFPAGFEVEAFDVVAPKALARIIKQTRAVATHGELVTSDWDLADTFFLDYTSGVSDPGLFDYTGDESASSDRMTWAVEA